MSQDPISTQQLGTDPQDIARAARVLRGGGIIAFPTDTVYGVGACALNPHAVRKLYTAKQRPLDKAIPLLLPSVESLSQVARDIPPSAYDLAERFWPGALTLIVPRRPEIPDIVTAGGETVAVRVPDHPVTLALLKALDAPLAATSANLSAQPPAIDAAQVLAQLEGCIDLLLDGGTCPGGVASTVLDLTTSPVRVLRAGPLRSELDAWL